uniref:Antitoxin n=1 Tax=mine drainage metagenome TaxID=410659 RepID=E6QKD1_9ZZZZ
MATVSATEAKQRFAAVLDLAQREPVTICRNKRTVAVLISAEDYQRFRAGQWREFNRLADEMARQAKENGLTQDELDLILSER